MKPLHAVALLAVLAGPLYAQDAAPIAPVVPPAPVAVVAPTVSGTAMTPEEAAFVAAGDQSVKVMAALAAHAPAPKTPFACVGRDVCFVWEDWAHAQVSAQLLYAPARGMAFDGGSVDAAVAYNPGVFASKWPTSWTAKGVPAPACAFLELGGGGDKHSGFVHAGASCNAAPLVVGWAAKGLTAAGGGYATFGTLLLAPDGSGLKISVGVKANVVQDGGVESAKNVKGEAVVGFGYIYKFK